MFLRDGTRNKWKMKQILTALAFPKAPVDRECFRSVPRDAIDEPGRASEQKKKNIYGNDRGRV
jgi:hypothetical protein